MRHLYMGLGWFSLFLGFIGIFLPLLPTTPFVLLAAYFFSKGSEKLHAWLLANKRFGPMIANWQQHGAISKRAKTMSISMMFLGSLYTLSIPTIPIWGKIGQALTLICVGIYILTRPSGPKAAVLEEPKLTPSADQPSPNPAP